MLSASFSKNMGLYGERTGLLSIINTDTEEKEMMQTRLKDTVLPYWSNPPVHGAKVFETIMLDEKLKA
jgi:aspartate aminotransferase